MRIFVAAVAISISGYAYSSPVNWTPVAYGGDDVTKIQIYVDLTRVTGTAEMPRAWTMADYIGDVSTLRSTNGLPFKSFITNVVYDCLNRTSAPLAMAYYDEPMAHGNPIDTLTFRRESLAMKAALPGSTGEKVLDTVCGHASRTIPAKRNRRPTS